MLTGAETKQQWNEENRMDTTIYTDIVMTVSMNRFKY